MLNCHTSASAGKSVVVLRTSQFPGEDQAHMGPLPVSCQPQQDRSLGLSIFHHHQTSPRGKPPLSMACIGSKAQENIAFIKGPTCSSGTLPFPSTAAALMYYSYSPSCPATLLAGCFLYWASLSEKAGLGCASALINQTSSAAAVLQPCGSLPSAFFYWRGRALGTFWDGGKDSVCDGTTPPPRTLQKGSTGASRIFL